MSDIHPNLEVVGEYTGITKKVKVRCKIHNYGFNAIPDNLLRGKGCRLCGIERSAQSKYKDFNDIIEEFRRQNVVLLSTKDEITCLTTDRLRYLCPIHGEQTILWGNFKKGARCRKCANKENSFRMKSETWERIQEYFQHSEYVLVSTFEEYTGAKDSCLKCLCKDHGEFKISWNNLNKFEGCSVCNSSSGERKIFHCLRRFNIKFEHPKRFDDLIGVGGKKLSYDFYLPDNNILIEYQGEQHEHPVVFPNMDAETSEINFKKQQEHDKRKREYARDNNINLLEIWYYDFDNIDNILNEYLLANTKCLL